MTSELIARLEAATADQQRELLIEAFEAFHPYPGPRHYLVTEIDWSWDRMRDRFMRMLDAEAYESAALTLVPEGYAVEVSLWPKQTSHCEIIGTHLRNDEYWHTGKDGKWRSQAATPALAIVIAALRAKGEG